MQKTKDSYFQAVRGICICFVILIHCQSQGNTVIAEFYQIVLRQIINFAVAVFVFMAGYFARPYHMSGEEHTKTEEHIIGGGIVTGLGSC